MQQYRSRQSQISLFFTCLCCQRHLWWPGSHPKTPAKPWPQQPGRRRAISPRVLESCCHQGYDCWLRLQAAKASRHGYALKSWISDYYSIILALSVTRLIMLTHFELKFLLLAIINTTSQSFQFVDCKNVSKSGSISVFSMATLISMLMILLGGAGREGGGLSFE